MVFEKFIKAVKSHSLVQCGDRVIVSVSGGADSTALLHLLLQIRQQYKLALTVGHFNHKLRGKESDADEEFVKNLAARYKLPYIAASNSCSGSVRIRKHCSEGWARQLRYDFLTKLAENQSAQKIALGHTMNDQAETVLMRLIRGSGTLGLAAIPVMRENLFIRPLLQISRNEILNYLRDNHLTWREDSSNIEDKYLRNRIRHQLVPLLEGQYNPNIVELLSQTATRLREDVEALFQINNEIFAKEACLSTETITWNAKTLASFPAGIAKNLIRYSIFKLISHSEFVSARNVEDIYGLLYTGKSGKYLTIGQVRVTRDFHSMTFTRIGTAHTDQANYSCHLPIPGRVEIAKVGSIFTAVFETGSDDQDLLGRWEFYVSPEELSSGLRIRNWNSGDAYFPCGASGTKKVKELFASKKITKNLRAVWPIVTLNDRIIFAKGLPISADRISGDSSRRNKKIIVEESKLERRVG